MQSLYCGRLTNQTSWTSWIFPWRDRVLGYGLKLVSLMLSNFFFLTLSYFRITAFISKCFFLALFTMSLLCKLFAACILQVVRLLMSHFNTDVLKL